VGLFDESLPCNEDYELNYRLRRAGGRIYYSPEIRWDYFNRESLPELMQQYWRYGRGKAMVLKRHPRSVMPRHLAAPTLALASLAAVALAATGRPLPMLLLIGSYGGASAYFARQAGRGG